MLSTRMRMAAAGNVPAGGGQYYMSFNGTSSFINAGSDSSLDNLPSAGDFTAEVMLNLPTGISGQKNIFGKQKYTSGHQEGWRLYVNPFGGGGLVYATLYTDDTSAQVSNNAYAGDAGKDEWRHIAMTYNSSDQKVRLFFNGSLLTTSGAITGSIYSDAAHSVYLAREEGISAYLQCGIAWARLSDNLRYTGSYTAPTEDSPPAVDANTVEQWNLNDGSGGTASAEVNSSNNGTITDGTWNAF